MKRTWKQDLKTGKMIEVTTQRKADSSTEIIRAFSPFISIVDGSTISNRRQLEEHNKRNNVTQDPFTERIAARTKERDNLFGGRYIDPTRNADIRDAIERCRSEGDNRYKYD